MAKGLLHGASAAAFLGVLTSVTPALAGSNRYIVRVKAPESSNGPYRSLVSRLNVNAVHEELTQNLEGVQTAAKFSKVGIVIVEGDENSIESALDRNPLVAYYEVDKEWTLASYAVGAPLSASAHTPSGQYDAPWMKDVLGLNASEPSPTLGYTGTSPVLVAVVDTGATLNHPYLADGFYENTRDEADGNDDDGNGYADDTYGANVFSLNGDTTENNTDHGSHVAGLIKSVRDQAIQVDAKARNVQILPIRFINESGVGSTSGAIAALNYAAARGAKVVNCSWGARGTEAFSQALYDAMKDLYTKSDMVITVAAGNAERAGPNNNDVTPYFPSSFNIPSLISVASVTPEYEYASGGAVRMTGLSLSSFSNYGSRAVHVAAPGGFRDANFDSSGLYSANAHFTGSSDYYIRKMGTSMAAPVVAGIAGVVRAINPSLTAFEVRQLVLDTAVRKSNLSTATSTSGVVNAAAAFAAAATAHTQGLKPDVPANAYDTSAASDSSASSSSSGGTKASGGGCGAIASAGHGNEEGPLGGNSLLLFAALYFVSIFARRALSHIRGNRLH